MILRAVSTIILISVIIMLIIADASAQKKNAQYEGTKPYTPTRLEWIAVELNSGFRTDLTPESGFSLTFVPLHNQNTILIYVRYLPTVNREIMNSAISTARELIDIKADYYGWRSWLKVREDIKMSPLPK